MTPSDARPRILSSNSSNVRPVGRLGVEPRGDHPRVVEQSSRSSGRRYFGRSSMTRCSTACRSPGARRATARFPAAPVSGRSAPVAARNRNRRLSSGSIIASPIQRTLPLQPCPTRPQPQLEPRRRKVREAEPKIGLGDFFARAGWWPASRLGVFNNNGVLGKSKKTGGFDFTINRRHRRADLNSSYWHYYPP